MFNCPSQIWGKIHQCSFRSWENVTLLRHKPVWKAKLNKTFFTWHISMVGSPASPHSAYLWTSSVKGSLVKAEWYGIFLCLWSHCPVTFVLKAGEAISDVVRDPRDVVSPDKELFCFIERSTRNLRRSTIWARGLWMTRVDNGDYQFIIAPNLNSLARKMWEPECASHYYI